MRGSIARCVCMCVFMFAHLGVFFFGFYACSTSSCFCKVRAHTPKVSLYLKPNASMYLQDQMTHTPNSSMYLQDQMTHTPNVSMYLQDQMTHTPNVSMYLQDKMIQPPDTLSNVHVCTCNRCSCYGTPDSRMHALSMNHHKTYRCLRRALSIAGKNVYFCIFSLVCIPFCVRCGRLLVVEAVLF